MLPLPQQVIPDMLKNGRTGFFLFHDILHYGRMLPLGYIA
jgi:hypothetical protein